MFTIAEELLLLAMDDEKGTVIFSASDSLNYGLAGAILAELTILERIELNDKKVVVINEEKTGVTFLDSVLTEIKQSDKSKKVDDWINRINSKMGQLRQDMIQLLVEKGILKEEEKKILWIFNQSTYPTDQKIPEQEIRNRVHASLFGDKKPNARTAMLLSLIKSCNLVDEVFSKAEKKEATKRMDNIIKNHDYGKAVKASIEEMQTAVIVACTTVVIFTNN
ncbi:GOLPH3/VPS74 family protein [Virgibacillus ihumii]|uniref:GOLPH3/VPS74 family protein n=1 Tax=Virgibacillus ihumii TaxID=2686091 RepID=UPI00157E0F48|nr:GPP34 family phosphoprotein [Virgibacillus ihumii]